MAACWELIQVLFHKDLPQSITGDLWAIFPIPPLFCYHMLMQKLLCSVSFSENLLSLVWGEGGLRTSGPPQGTSGTCPHSS